VVEVSESVSKETYFVTRVSTLFRLTMFLPHIRQIDGRNMMLESEGLQYARLVLD
jgi:hypothetical protein